ncbi:hypothetical protein SAMN02745724_02400 [Pseudoalteromonas denitrificans DSM 6059]|uniref:Uncharacterized protein n=1 Tax=Pseudoalteromonas denitrificans DSM 6059 TaxID=1123010 RepID=A0A1I1LID2_9GAMM|nr:hypothetical protein SAMN02745724_02400 [Pseudoalteromonas denitrificans DSM 6059]
MAIAVNIEGAFGSFLDAKILNLVDLPTIVSKNQNKLSELILNYIK